jgi:hypothetical protein
MRARQANNRAFGDLQLAIDAITLDVISNTADLLSGGSRH